jgi:hypothetical protein
MAVERRFADDLLADPEAAIKEYRSRFGHELNADNARELSPDYLSDPSRFTNAVHEPSSWLVKKIYEKMLAEKPGPGERPEVTFTAGGAGSGKGSATQNVPAIQKMMKRSQIVYDTVMRDSAGATKKIDQALAAGKNVNIVYVMRDPHDAWLNGVISRAKSKGRVVTVASHADGHEGAARTIQEIAEHYAGNDRVNIHVIDNTRGPGKAKLGNIENVKGMDYNGLVDTLVSSTDKELHHGNIEETLHRHLLGKLADKRSSQDSAVSSGAGSREALPGTQPQDLQRSDSAGLRGLSEQERNSGLRSEVNPPDGVLENAVAEQVLQAKPNLEITLDNGETVSAREAFADADAQIQQAQRESSVFSAAVQCFLRG